MDGRTDDWLAAAAAWLNIVLTDNNILSLTAFPVLLSHPSEAADDGQGKSVVLQRALH